MANFARLIRKLNLENNQVLIGRWGALAVIRLISSSPTHHV